MTMMNNHKNIWSSTTLGKRWEPPSNYYNMMATNKRRKVSQSFASVTQAKQFLEQRRNHHKATKTTMVIKTRNHREAPKTTMVITTTTTPKRKREEPTQVTTVLESGEIAETACPFIPMKRRRVVSPSSSSSSTTAHHEDVKEVLLQKEATDKITAGFLPDDKVRRNVVDWLLSLGDKYQLLAETVHLAVALLDRSLTKVQDVTPEDPQLIGFACLWMAIKYEEKQEEQDYKFQGLASFCTRVAKGAFGTKDVVAMEMKILRALGFNISNMPTASTFMGLLIEASPIPVDMKTAKRARFILDTSLLSASLMAEYLPSQLTTAAVILAYGERVSEMDIEPEPVYRALAKEHNRIMDNPNLRRGWRRVRLECHI